MVLDVAVSVISSFRRNCRNCQRDSYLILHLLIHIQSCWEWGVDVVEVFDSPCRSEDARSLSFWGRFNGTKDILHPCAHRFKDECPVLQEFACIRRMGRESSILPPPFSSQIF